MRALKILVVVMGVMLVGGTAALIAAIIDRASRHTPQAAAPRGHGFGSAAVSLPAGARVLTTELAGDRVLVRLALAEGGEALLLVDAKSGTNLGIVYLLPATTGEAKP
ncbi:MAG TPA: hypothetical protein VGU20_11100 [Stellaceae bacterium]|nr:hypothetical protein [Stellaceae bacterium]